MSTLIIALPACLPQPSGVGQQRASTVLTLELGESTYRHIFFFNSRDNSTAAYVSKWVLSLSFPNSLFIFRDYVAASGLDFTQDVV